MEISLEISRPLTLQKPLNGIIFSLKAPQPCDNTKPQRLLLSSKLSPCYRLQLINGFNSELCTFELSGLFMKASIASHVTTMSLQGHSTFSIVLTLKYLSLKSRQTATSLLDKALSCAASKHNVLRPLCIIPVLAIGNTI